jgi:hypothetical protein
LRRIGKAGAASRKTPAALVRWGGPCPFGQRTAPPICDAGNSALSAKEPPRLAPRRLRTSMPDPIRPVHWSSDPYSCVLLENLWRPRSPKHLAQSGADVTRPTIDVYTDGGCRRIPGVGAWAAVIYEGPEPKEISGVERLTNQQPDGAQGGHRSFESP